MHNPKGLAKVSKVEPDEDHPAEKPALDSCLGHERMPDH